ncbi:MAG: glucosaminidase domain-containing protein [Prevotellaceae bacterium]|jgi:LysM repeat protein|nr:glucosaminidase domain-containing protein [Prevotellaceae bacterium]
MKKKSLLLALLILITHCIFAQKLTREQYIEKYRNIAIRQMKSYGIPASIILAQACLESNNGNSSLAVKGKNHFGIKCAGWQGRKVYHDDDKANECFRAYGTDEESFVDHSDFLRYRQRYAFLFDLKITDYKGWARGLKKAGYATAPKYAEMLIKIIEDFQLYKYDDKNYTPPPSTTSESTGNANTAYKKETKPIEVVKKPSEAMREYNIDNFVITLNRNIGKRNGVKYIIAKYNDTYERIGDEFKMSAEQLRKYNDAAKNEQPVKDDIVYIAAKKSKAGKDFPMHVAEAGETLRSISQLYGVKLRDLCKKNNMPADETLEDEQVVYLRNDMKK